MARGDGEEQLVIIAAVQGHLKRIELQTSESSGERRWYPHARKAACLKASADTAGTAESSEIG